MSIAKKIICLAPVFNDWESFQVLLKDIESEFGKHNPEYAVQVIAINDGSTDDVDTMLTKIPVELINLKKNVGHQRAIAIGLQYINSERSDFDFVIVLDSDGEDNPKDIIRLIAKCEELQSGKIVFAQRKKRQETLLFKIGYFFYKSIFYGLTGQKISFGNFSCIPKRILNRVVLEENLWNHYSGSVIQSKLPFDKILLDRGRRYVGHSKMNFTSLTLHGLSSISVYFDFLSIRILKISMVGVICCVFSVLGVLYVKLFTDSSIPGWASNLILIIIGIILQLSSVTLIVLLMQLSARKNVSTPSSSIYKGFIDSIVFLNESVLKPK